MGNCVVAPLTNYPNIFQNLGHRYWSGLMNVHLSTTYAAGGDAITPNQVGFGSVIEAMIVTTNATSQTSFWLFVLNTTNPGAPTIQAFTANGTPATTTALSEFSGNDLSAFTFSAIFVGV